MRPYLITAKLMRPSNMKRFPTPVLRRSRVTRETNFISNCDDRRNDSMGDYYDGNQAVSWFNLLVAGLSPRRPRFASRSVNEGFMADKVALGQVVLGVLRFSPSI
jgi:hypothetical protein